MNTPTMHKHTAAVCLADSVGCGDGASQRKSQDNAGSRQGNQDEHRSRVVAAVGDFVGGGARWSIKARRASRQGRLF